MPSLISTLLERKVVQWGLAYLAAAWATLEALGFLADLFGWGQSVVRVTTVLLGAGFLAAVVLSWYHGETGTQKVTRLEAALLGLVAIAGVAGAVVIGPVQTDAEDDRHVQLSVAVLPPTTLSGTVQDHFVTGMHDALITQLAQIGAIRVISRRSTARYAGSTRPLPEIARELGVDAIVESSVARPGDSVTIEIRLVQAVPRERLLWSKRFHARLEGVFTMHSDVARAIAREVRAEVTPAEESRLATAGSVDPETYEAYLRGMHLIYKGGPANIERGLEHLHDAVERSPASARAYAGLALGYSALGHGPAPPPEAWTRAREAARRAIALHPDLAEAHAALADVMLYHDWDWEGAEREFRRAIELNPSLAMNRYHYAWYLILFDRMEEATFHHELAIELDPLTPVHTSGMGHLYLWEEWSVENGRRAVEAAQKALELNPAALNALHVLGDGYLAMGRTEEAVAAHRRLVDVSPVGLWILGGTYAAAGMEEEARSILTTIETEPNPWNAFGLVVMGSKLGDFDLAFRWLEYEPHHAWVPWVRNAPWTVELQGDPRFQEFVRRLDLPDARTRLAAH